MTYRIKPLEWKEHFGDWIRAETSIGTYCACPELVEFIDGQNYWKRGIADLAHGKELAEEHYRFRLLSALEKVEEKDD